MVKKKSKGDKSKKSVNEKKKSQVERLKAQKEKLENRIAPVQERADTQFDKFMEVLGKSEVRLLKHAMYLEKHEGEEDERSEKKLISFHRIRERADRIFERFVRVDNRLDKYRAKLEVIDSKLEKLRIGKARVWVRCGNNSANCRSINCARDVAAMMRANGDDVEIVVTDRAVKQLGE